MKVNCQIQWKSLNLLLASTLKLTLTALHLPMTVLIMLDYLIFLENVGTFIIKVAGARMKRLNRFGFAFKAKNLQGNVILQGVSSCTRKTSPLIVQEAMLEAAMWARESGCYNLLFLSDSFKVV